MNETLADLLAESQLQAVAEYLLRTVPGLPPIAQSFHILGIGAVMASSVMVNLRLLGLAVPSQDSSEMIRRLFPWTWAALGVNLVSGSLFVFARPARYFLNPIFGYKVMMLVPAFALVAFVHWLALREDGYWDRSSDRRLTAKAIAIVSLLLWVGIILAGRWIAYSEYLFYFEF